MIGKKKEITSSSKLCMVHGNVISNRRNIEFQEVVKADIPARELRHSFVGKKCKGFFLRSKSFHSSLLLSY